jgi:TonB family protein
VSDGTGSVTLLPEGHTVTGTYQRYPLAKDGGRIATMFFGEDALAGVDKASAIEVRLGGESHRLAVPGIRGAMAALATCQDDLIRGWGVDPAERKLEATHVQGNPGRFFGPSAYPPEAVRSHAQGRVVTLATIGPKGEVTACRVLESSGQSSGNKALDAATCAIVLHEVHFTPARDKAGHGVTTHYMLPVRWVLPG